MNDDQIKEVMRLADEIADYAWKEGLSDGAYSNAKQDRECRAESRAELEAYLRTIGEPESMNAELLEALKGMVDAHAIPSSYCKERPVYDQARAAIARAESAIESPAKVSPCAGHAVQQEADEAKICATCRFLTKNGGCQSKGTSYNCVDYCQWEANESGGA